LQKDRHLVRAAGSMSAMTALSRVAGYVRDNLQAQILGAANSSDAFVIAFRIPNMLRRLVAEGALTAAFVPTFTRYMRRHDRGAMWRFAGSVFYALSAALAVIVVLGILFSPVLVKTLAWGFGGAPDKMDLTISLSRWMFPYIAFVSLTALASGILNAFDAFALPAFTPVLLNLSIVGCALALRDRFGDPAHAFAAGVLLGGALQLAIQIPPLVRRGLDLSLPRPFDREGVREVGRLMLPRIFGVGITQVNLVVDSQFATSLRSGSVSFLYYANRVTELTLGIFGVSLSTVILPTLSRAAAEGDHRRVLDTLSMAVRLLVFITLPATVGLVILRVPIMHVLFERGRFTREDTLLSAGALACYSLGLLPYASVNVLATAFYAHRDTRTPVMVGLATFVLHLGLNFALRAPLAQNGIALSTAASALVDSLLMAWLLRRRFGEFLHGEVRISLARTTAAAGAMAGALLLAAPHWDVLAARGILHKTVLLFGLVGGGAGLYATVSHLLGGQEVRLILSVLRSRE